jgi:GH35 family endo-1,4-beta-xylanase
VLALGALVAASSAQAATPKGFFGVVPQRPLTVEDYERMGQANVGTLRFELLWAQANPSPGAYDWTAPDHVVAEAARNGVRTLPFVYSTPSWVARDLDRHRCSADACYPFGPKSKAARDAWADFLAAAVERYGPDGSFWVENPTLRRRPIRAWQLWNEQNSPSFYKPKPDVKRFAKLLKAGERAITKADRGAEIVMGGMFGTPLQGRKPALSAWKFLRKLYRVKGAKKSFDGVAPHPYAPKLKNVRAQVDLIRDEMKDAGDRNADLWITELGWASGGPRNPLNRGKKGQAQRLKQAFKYFKKKRKKLNVRNVDWYSWRDNLTGDANLCAWCPHSGLVDENLTEKPSLAAFTKFTGGS